MKKIRKKPGLKGFTLVELMTVLVIMTILIAIASGVIITTFNIFGKNTIMRAAQNEGNNVYNYIYEHISYAGSLKIAGNDDIKYMGGSENPKTVYGFDDVLDEKEYTVQTEAYGDSPALIREDSIVPYFEVIDISFIEKNGRKEKGIVRLKRKTVDVPVDIFGTFKEEVVSDIKTETPDTPAGFECYVEFSGYNADLHTVTFKVEIRRDGEVFYSKEGAVPLLNKPERVSVTPVNNKTGDIKIFYTYLQ